VLRSLGLSKENLPDFIDNDYYCSNLEDEASDIDEDDIYSTDSSSSDCDAYSSFDDDSECDSSSEEESSSWTSDVSMSSEQICENTDSDFKENTMIVSESSSDEIQSTLNEDNEEDDEDLYEQCNFLNI
jgi:hypothetical protein